MKGTLWQVWTDENKFFELAISNFYKLSKEIIKEKSM